MWSEGREILYEGESGTGRHSSIYEEEFKDTGDRENLSGEGVTGLSRV